MLTKNCDFRYHALEFRNLRANGPCGAPSVGVSIAAVLPYRLRLRKQWQLLNLDIVRKAERSR